MSLNWKAGASNHTKVGHGLGHNGPDLDLSHCPKAHCVATSWAVSKGLVVNVRVKRNLYLQGVF